AAAMSNHYQTLGISRDASRREVIQAYHALALQHHPDRPSGSTQAFQRICSAFEVLGDEAKRHAYNFALVERANRDGMSSDSMLLRPTVTGEEAHVLADYPVTFAKLLLSAKPALWGRLLRALSRKQLDELKACLHSAESGKRIRLDKSENLQQLRGLDNLHAKGSGYVAKLTLDHLEVASPFAATVAVAAYYHSAVLELRNLIRGHTVASPRCTFEEAVLRGMASLDEQGMACPLTFRARFGHTDASLLTDDVGLALQMRTALLAAPARARSKVKAEWGKVVTERRRVAADLLPKTASRLLGFIMAREDSLRDMPIPKLRRRCKQPAAVVLQVPLLPQTATRLGLLVQEMQERLASGEGQKALQQLFQQKHPAIAEGPKITTKEGLQVALGRLVSGDFLDVVDMCTFAAVDKQMDQILTQAMSCRGTLTLDPRSFRSSMKLILGFLGTRFAHDTQVIDLRFLPNEMLRDSTLWPLLYSLPALQRVHVRHDAPSAPRNPKVMLQFDLRAGATSSSEMG
ncbi:dnaJ, partial [Symbiodinium sp. CCMP2456]